MADKKQAPVPSSRIGRFVRVVKLAGGVTGGMVAEGSRRWRRGEGLKPRDLLLTASNARRLTDELANMRGAAMKLGQMLSMDTGDLLPKELTDILARLRSDGVEMPPEQLDKAMNLAYGEDWQALFYGFDHAPIAAASIGQVHRAYAPDGSEIALKIQYPGVAKSIGSDVDNIASLLNLAGIFPKGFDIKPLLKAAKEQLASEADYLEEADHLASFGRLLADDSRFLVPQVFKELTRENVLVMSYIDSQPIEVVADLPQADRDRVVTALFDLMLMEFFELRLVQTDPNFANYRYRATGGEVVLLDFGATRKFKASFVNGYKRLVGAGLRGDDEGVMAAAAKLGYIVDQPDDGYRDLLSKVFSLVMEPLLADEPYDFGRSDLSARMNALGDSVWEFRDAWQAPPTDAVFFHRKVGGMFMLAARLKASVNLCELIQTRI
ncbi:MAG: putative unusual protein kinase regulating ubiquinone biosynthesis (AarF/ABC1/UbiB family) [Halieaceae bacterium]|jgi:predicted unusual protein kinase regulating ubiquinone biosynthesis (AarF/ABC1/UbiB family)